MCLHHDPRALIKSWDTVFVSLGSNRFAYGSTRSDALSRAADAAGNSSDCSTSFAGCTARAIAEHAGRMHVMAITFPFASGIEHFFAFETSDARDAFMQRLQRALLAAAEAVDRKLDASAGICAVSDATLHDESKEQDGAPMQHEEYEEDIRILRARLRNESDMCLQLARQCLEVDVQLQHEKDNSVRLENDLLLQQAAMKALEASTSGTEEQLERTQKELEAALGSIKCLQEETTRQQQTLEDAIAAVHRQQSLSEELASEARQTAVLQQEVTVLKASLARLEQVPCDFARVRRVTSNARGAGARGRCEADSAAA